MVYTLLLTVWRSYAALESERLGWVHARTRSAERPFVSGACLAARQQLPGAARQCTRAHNSATVRQLPAAPCHSARAHAHKVSAPHPAAKLRPPCWPSLVTCACCGAWRVSCASTCGLALALEPLPLCTLQAPLLARARRPSQGGDRGRSGGSGGRRRQIPCVRGGVCACVCVCVSVSRPESGCGASGLLAVGPSPPSAIRSFPCAPGSGIYASRWPHRCDLRQGRSGQTARYRVCERGCNWHSIQRRHSPVCTATTFKYVPCCRAFLNSTASHCLSLRGNLLSKQVKYQSGP